MNSESCIDDIDIQILVVDNIIKDFRFDGVGCTIATASTSILSELVIDQTIQDAYKIEQSTLFLQLNKLAVFGTFGTNLTFFGIQKPPALLRVVCIMYLTCDCGYVQRCSEPLPFSECSS
jgi:NifU-like protein involved in Fe-S cluster formation